MYVHTNVHIHIFTNCIHVNRNFKSPGVCFHAFMNCWLLDIVSVMSHCIETMVQRSVMIQVGIQVLPHHLEKKDDSSFFSITLETHDIDVALQQDDKIMS